MLYTLPDGRSFELDLVTRVSRIRDEGEDASSIEYSKLSFHIYFSDRDTIEVIQQYHYSDWAVQKKNLNRIRAELLNSIKNNGGEVDDD